MSFLAVQLLPSGCSQQKVFDFSAPVAQAKSASKILSEDSSQTIAISPDATTPIISQKVYKLDASNKQPFPVRFFPKYTATSPVPTQAMAIVKNDKWAKRTGKATAKDLNPSSLPLPTESKVALVFAVISLIALGFVVLPGFTLGTYLIGMLIGLIAFSFSFILGLLGKSKGTKQPEKYNEKGAKRVGVFSWVLAALLATILLALLII
ncbi:hypothetical protein DC20_09325 [Rufibacter tibetensis]|uniref:Uncharacterized protein n=1 Tax=Rufibacter tibetensis TaxID=512763 RepID=A0A0P0CV03_9BACT|nr:hypothetical protein DC20_09325 [Rufibacter tibetensis]